MVENVTQIRSGITIKIYVRVKNRKEHYECKKYYILKPAACGCKCVKCLGSIIGDLVIKCDEIIEEINAVLTANVPTKSTSTNFFILLVFSIITITLLTAVSIYCYLIKYLAEPRTLLPCH